jgi:hypothetical protein
MMDNAKWREKEREKNIANFKAQNEEEKIRNREYNGDFFRYRASCDSCQNVCAIIVARKINIL